MQNGLVGSFAGSCRFPYQIAIENQSKMASEASGPFLLDLPRKSITENECNMALEAPGHVPLDLLLKSLLKINAKWPWRPLSSFLQMSVLKPRGKSMQHGLEAPWQFPVDFPIKSLLNINAKWTCGPLGSFL